MVWSWLRNLLKKEKKRPENASPHTMGPEELLDETREAEDEKYSPIEPAGIYFPSHPKKSENEWESDDGKWEPELELEEKSPGKKDAQRIMEAALFMGSKGLGIEELSRIANVSILNARMYIPELVDSFNARNLALEIVEDARGFRMKVRSPYDEKVSHLAGATELSPAELKTLAFIAYKQPLLQSQLVQVRSNTAYEHLHVLLEKGFLSREPKGRSYILRTTKKFSEYFGTHALKLKPMKKDENNAPQ
jgi:segregation and condensation protein B